MFEWTVPRVLAAIDAGIAEVISTFNNSYTFALRQKAAFPGQPVATVPHAYDFAMVSTITWLDQLEAECLMVKAIDSALLSAEYYLAGCAGTMADRVDAMAHAQNIRAEDWAEATI